MNLLESCVNEKCKILSIDLGDELKNHMIAMGLCPNAVVCIKRYGLFKSSVQLQIGERIIALGKQQAKSIQIQAA